MSIQLGSCPSFLSWRAYSSNAVSRRCFVTHTPAAADRNWTMYQVGPGECRREVALACYPGQIVEDLEN